MSWLADYSLLRQTCARGGEEIDNYSLVGGTRCVHLCRESNVEFAMVNPCQDKAGSTHPCAFKRMEFILLLYAYSRQANDRFWHCSIWLYTNDSPCPNLNASVPITTGQTYEK